MHPPDGGTGQLSPLARILTPRASFFVRNCSPFGQRKHAQAVALPRPRIWSVGHSSWSWMSAANEFLPSGADSGPCGQVISVEVGTENALMWAAIPL